MRHSLWNATYGTIVPVVAAAFATTVACSRIRAWMSRPLAGSAEPQAGRLVSRRSRGAMCLPVHDVSSSEVIRASSAYSCWPRSRAASTGWPRNSKAAVTALLASAHARPAPTASRGLGTVRASKYRPSLAKSVDSATPASAMLKSSSWLRGAAGLRGSTGFGLSMCRIWKSFGRPRLDTRLRTVLSRQSERLARFAGTNHAVRACSRNFPVVVDAVTGAAGSHATSPKAHARRSLIEVGSRALRSEDSHSTTLSAKTNCSAETPRGVGGRAT